MEKDSRLRECEIQQRNSVGRVLLIIALHVVEIADIISPPLHSSPYQFSTKIIE